MTVFGQYADYYDELYKDKEYAVECDFLETVFSKVSKSPIKKILDLGCGTGSHALTLAARGFAVWGVDQSANMLAIAREKIDSETQNTTIKLSQGDIRDVELEEKFDAVISMFAVMSYMTTNNDIHRAFSTARKHLNVDGLFVFDFWYGPGVISNPPVDRFKEISQGTNQIIRFAHPSLHPLDQVVDVNYRLLTIDGTYVVSEFTEVHQMRYFFPQELVLLLQNTGFELLKLCPFLKLELEPNNNDWTACVVAKAI